MKAILLALLGCCFFLIANVNAIQPPSPDAGTILRETEKPVLEAPSYEEEVSYAPEKAKQAKRGKAIYVKGFKFTSTTKFLPTQELKKLLANYTGKNVDMADLDIAKSIIADYYAKRGYIYSGT